MSIKQRNLENPNPLNFFEVRQVKILPPHFESVSFINPLYNLEGTIIKWIVENLKGRFYIGTINKLNDSNTYEKSLEVGFENPKELSYFTLACPYLKYK